MKLTHIELLESLGNEQQLMRLTFDGGKDSAYIIWSHANLMQYLNDEVIATFRQDMYNGAVVKFVNTLASVGVVHTLERSDNVKLYVDVTDNHSNIRFKEIEDGGTAVNAIVYVVDIRFDSYALYLAVYEGNYAEGYPGSVLSPYRAAMLERYISGNNRLSYRLQDQAKVRLLVYEYECR